jgi:hypothetical protein
MNSRDQGKKYVAAQVAVESGITYVETDLLEGLGKLLTVSFLFSVL